MDKIANIAASEAERLLSDSELDAVGGGAAFDAFMEAQHQPSGDVDGRDFLVWQRGGSPSA
jgi:hypothetical protein